MRRALLTVAALVCAAGALSPIVAQVAAPPGAQPGAPPATGGVPVQPPGGPGGQPGEMPPPPGPMFGTRVEAFLAQPGRVVVRDVYAIGEFEGRPWDARPNDVLGWVRVRAIVAYDPARPAEKVKGLEVILSDDRDDRTFLFDGPQIADVQAAIRAVTAAAGEIRPPAEGIRRRAVVQVNGLEVGMEPGRTGGHLAQFGPDDVIVRLNPDNFRRLGELLDQAADTLTRADR